MGSGFSSPDLILSVGGQPAFDVVVLSDQLMRATTPPAGGAGVVDVGVAAGGAQASLSGVFTYYEPGFRYGGSRDCRRSETLVRSR